MATKKSAQLTLDADSPSAGDAIEVASITEYLRQCFGHLQDESAGLRVTPHDVEAAVERYRGQSLLRDMCCVDPKGMTQRAAIRYFDGSVEEFRLSAWPKRTVAAESTEIWFRVTGVHLAFADIELRAETERGAKKGSKAKLYWGQADTAIACENFFVPC